MFIPRTLARTEGPGRGAWARAAIVGGFLAVAIFAVLSVNIGAGQVSLAVGDVVTADISAPSTRSFVSDSQTEAARQAAADAVDPIFEPIAPRADIRARQLRFYDGIVRAVRLVLLQRDSGTLTTDEVLTELADAVPAISDEQVALLATTSVTRWALIANAGRTVLDATMAAEVREDELADARQQVRTNITNELSQPERELAGDLAAAQVAPNAQLSETRTAAAQQAARSAVEPVVVEVRQGQTIVRAGDAITALDLEKLDQLGLTRPRLEATTLAGHALVALLLAGMLVAFLWRFEPGIWFRNRSLLLFGLALVTTAVALRIASDRTLWAFVVPSAATVLLTSILLDGAAGAAMAVALAFLAGVMNQDAFAPAIYTLAGGLAALITIVRAERLNVFVRAGVALGITNVVVLTAFNLIEQRDLAAIVQGVVAGGVNAALSVILAVGSFAVLGHLFGIMTVFQLLELANPSARLLRRLLMETPGTYHHSVLVGNLAERAAETIGADPLLAKVASYYHDIGKMKNPLAFIENQAGARNIHDDLTPEASARIIAGHVRDGIDLGYEFGLPVQIIGFIPQHHGTSVMSYFYGKALRELGGDGDATAPDRYRYPGPKPQSREAAILMLADGVEASVRSLDEKDEASIRAMVDRIVDARVDDGQLDEADLTLRNITQIKEAFVEQLQGMYHTRIPYPDNVVPMEPEQRDLA
ncbi:MAG TPA: HDIG domain-containing protein [Candidatus Limnocylindria bacterium]|nr:HDIG domain-containing protein [Candidatus Limnocylindria bacterium]